MHVKYLKRLYQMQLLKQNYVVKDKVSKLKLIKTFELDHIYYLNIFENLDFFRYLSIFMI